MPARHVPWNGQTLTCGMEFGVSPFPESRREMIERPRALRHADVPLDAGPAVDRGRVPRGPAAGGLAALLAPPPIRGPQSAARETSPPRGVNCRQNRPPPVARLLPSKIRFPPCSALLHSAFSRSRSWARPCPGPADGTPSARRGATRERSCITRTRCIRPTPPIGRGRRRTAGWRSWPSTKTGPRPCESSRRCSGSQGSRSRRWTGRRQRPRCTCTAASRRRRRASIA